MRKYALELNDLVGQVVEIGGWISARRDHGKLMFLDITDTSGITQVVVLPGTLDSEVAKKLKLQSAVTISGLVKAREERMINSNIVSGKIEIQAQDIHYLASADELPFELSGDTLGINEQTRLQYRYLDLRTTRMRENIKLRHEVIKFIRQFLYKKDFIEVETPILTKSTPEGARDYVVPSRVYPGNFYALPQAPQQYKQLLMVAQVERYFQIVRCFRDEDQRADRQPEFTQLDMEMSFINQEDVLSIVESMIIELVKTLFPEKKITLKPFPRLDFDTAIERYDSDRPDLRKNKEDNDELSFVWIVNFPLFEYKSGDKRWGPTHNPFTACTEATKEELFKQEPDLRKVYSQQYDLVLNGNEIFGGSIRITDPVLQSRVFEILGMNKTEIEEKFGHMLSAFKYGVPPHGGIAAGLDRLIMVLAQEKSIREVMAFPKLADGFDPMMNAPSALNQSQLDELKISLHNIKKNDRTTSA